MHAQISKMHRQLETFNAIRRKNINDIVYSCPFVSIRGSVQCLLFDCIILNKQLLVFYSGRSEISYYASSGTSPGRSGAFGATKTQYLSQKETHEAHPYQRIFRFIINNLMQRHSVFFAVFGQHRRTVLYNAKKTGIQIRPAAMNAHFPS